MSPFDRKPEIGAVLVHFSWIIEYKGSDFFKPKRLALNNEQEYIEAIFA